MADLPAKYQRVAQQLGPRGWLDDTVSLAYLGAHGREVGRTFDLFRESVLVRYASRAPDDAVPKLCEARQIEQAPGESLTAVRARLRRSFELHRERTTKDAYRNALEPLGVDPALVHVWNDHEAGLGVWWSSVYIVADMTLGDPWTLDLWDSGDWDDGGVWDLEGLSEVQLTWARRTIRRWKWAGAYPVAIWVWLSGDVWDTGDSWDSGTWADDGLAVPILLGHTWDEAEWLYGDVPDCWDDGGVWEDAFLTD